MKLYRYKNEVFYFDLKYRCYTWDSNSDLLTMGLTKISDVYNYIDEFLELRQQKELEHYEQNKNNILVIKHLSNGQVLIFVNGLLSKKYDNKRAFRNNIDDDFNFDEFLHYPYDDDNDYI